MNNFEIGEKVVCTDDSKRWFKLGGLKKGEIYTILGFNPYDGGLILKEVKSPRSGFNAYRTDRFRKVDYAFANAVIQMMQPAQKQVALKPQTRVSDKTKLYNFNFISLN